MVVTALQHGPLNSKHVEFSEVSTCNIWQKRIAIIEMARLKRICKLFRTIQIEVMVNTLQIQNMLKARAAECWYMWMEGENFLLNISPRFRADFAGLGLTPKSSIGNIESYLLHCHSFPIRRNSVYLGSVSVYTSTSTTEWRPTTTLNHSMLQQSHLMHRTYTVGYHQHGDGEV